MDDSANSSESSKGKTFVLDTNIFINDPLAVLDFAEDPENSVVLLDTALGEIDGLKRTPGFVGKNARVFSSWLEQRTRECGRSELSTLLEQGLRVTIDSEGESVDGGTLKFYSFKDRERPAFGACLSPADSEIIVATKTYMADHPDETVELVSHDTNVTSAARVAGVYASFRKTETFDINELYTGFRLVDEPEVYSQLCGIPDIFSPSGRKSKGLPIKQIDLPWVDELIPNEYVVFLDPDELAKQQNRPLGATVDPNCIWRYDLRRNSLVPAIYRGEKVLGFTPRNLEQQLVFDLNLHKHILGIVGLGPAGTGKTFVSLLLALDRALQLRDRLPEAKVMVTKRNVNVAKEEYGALPGDINAKLSSGYAGVAKNYAAIMKGNDGLLGLGLAPTFQKTLKDEFSPVELAPIGFIRGDTLLPEETILVDEAQNLEPHLVDSVISRVGDARIFLSGDVYQPDNPFTRPDSNGLVYLIDLLTNIPKDDVDMAELFGVVTNLRVMRGKMTRVIVQYGRFGNKGN